MTSAQIRTFLLAGRAVFTLQSVPTGKHFTYRFTRAPGGVPEQFRPIFVSVLIAPEVWGYIGTFRDSEVVPTRNTKIAFEAPSARAINWFLHQLARRPGELPRDVIFRHEGRCGKCGRPLTTPESIDCGIGPVCLESAL